VVSWCDYGQPFIAAIENGVLAGTQFHPEKSSDAGGALLTRWVESLTSSSLL
jgi:glutamine amidotransferase